MNSIEDFLIALKVYRDPKYGLLGDSVYPNDPSGNALLYEAHAARVVKDKIPSGIPHSEFYMALNILEAAPGLFMRKPLPAKDPQTHDDFIGATALNFSAAVEVYCRGVTKGWWYNNLNPEESFWQGIKNILLMKSSISSIDFWHGRMPGVPQHYMLAAGVDPGVLGWLTWLLSIFWSTKDRGNESGWLLTYLQVRTASERFPGSKWITTAESRFRSQLDKHYGGDVANIYAIYFGPYHPFASFCHWPVK